MARNLKAGVNIPNLHHHLHHQVPQARNLILGQDLGQAQKDLVISNINFK
jgi:hypothetical protein